ncbi:hypothetical protein [Plastoroseomonas arctica]|uniref:Uncharacterized protein n=1 Tax=Plastoroseomonas arctica TaxID=1509237 RepID=A0AAF1KMP6_9PROT|nr:hypothetical protein [Plastoroseomonas arctica]MBR0656681.1 hypothetical protein [Plastoroseomonas arctica]
MRIAYTREGQPLPVFEAGDFVRIKRDDLGSPIAYRGGEWGSVVSVDAHTADVQLAGFSRPATATLPYARAVPSSWLAPCDARGAAILLDQRDVSRSGLRASQFDDRAARGPGGVQDNAAPVQVGDLVRMRRDEEGEFVTARAGDWGEVLSVGAGQLDIRFAGFSRPKTAGMPVARGIPARLVEPCDRQGRAAAPVATLRAVHRWR